MTRARRFLIPTAFTAVIMLSGGTAAAAGSGIGSAHRATLSCGHTILVSTVATNNLTGCAGTALTIGADNVVLDLARHRVAGDGVSSGNTEQGILLAGRHGVTVQNGPVTGFDTGVMVDGGAGNRLTRLTVTANGEDIRIISSTGNTVTRNALRSNPQIGIELRDASNNQVTDNVLRHNSASLFVVGGENLLSGNVITDDGSSAGGIEGDRNTFRNNRIQGAASAGVNFRGSGNHVTGNVITDISAFEPGFDIDFSGGDDDRITGSRISRTLNEGIRLNVFENDNGIPAHRTTVSGNVVRDAGTVGIAVATDFEGSGTIDGTVITTNLVVAAVTDGIQVVSPGTTVTRNLLVRNASHGIEAVAGVIDGRDNVARANGAVPPCIGVVCH